MSREETLRTVPHTLNETVVGVVVREAVIIVVVAVMGLVMTTTVRVVGTVMAVITALMENGLHCGQVLLKLHQT